MDFKSMVDFLLTCPFIREVAKEIWAEVTGDLTGQCGLFDDGEQPAGFRDMEGNQLLAHHYALVIRTPSVRDSERIASPRFNQRFIEWVEQQNLAGNFPALPTNYQADSIRASNGRLMVRAQDGKSTLHEIPIIFKYWRFVHNG